MNVLAEAYNIRVIPHCWGTDLRNATTLHWLATIPNATSAIASTGPMLEYDRTENPFREAVLVEPLAMKDGYMDIPQKPGVGVEINRKALEKIQSMIYSSILKSFAEISSCVIIVLMECNGNNA